MLGQSTNLLIETLDNFKDGIFAISKDWDLIYLNKHATRIIGFESQDVVGKNLWKDFPRVKGTVFAENYALTMQDQQFRIFEAKSIFTETWFEVSVYPSKEGIIVQWHDITKRKKAEERVQELLETVKQERDKLSSLINSIPDEIWFADKYKKLTLANPSAVKEFGLDSLGKTTVEEIAGSFEVYRADVYRADGSIRPVEEAPPLRALKGEIIKNELEIVNTPVNAEKRFRQVNSVPVRDSKGDIIASVSVVRDITEIKES